MIKFKPEMDEGKINGNRLNFLVDRAPGGGKSGKGDPPPRTPREGIDPTSKFLPVRLTPIEGPIKL